MMRIRLGMIAFIGLGAQHFVVWGVRAVIGLQIKTSGFRLWHPLLYWPMRWSLKHLLQQLAFFRKQHKADRDYQLWEEGSHPQMIEDETVLRQKLEYIHQNPVKRGYSEGKNSFALKSICEDFCKVGS